MPASHMTLIEQSKAHAARRLALLREARERIERLQAVIRSMAEQAKQGRVG